MKIPPLIEKILLQSPTVGDMVVLSCEFHGTNKNPFRATVPNCVECQAVAIWLRNIIGNAERSDHDASDAVQKIGRAVANACQSERSHTFDFIPSTQGPGHFHFDPDSDKAVGTILISDS